MDLLAVLTAAGIDVSAGDDYQTWARPYSYSPVGVMWHHTAASDTTLKLIHDGRVDVPGPLSQIFIESRPGRLFHLVSDGYCNGSGKGLTAVLAATKDDQPPPGKAKEPGSIIGNRWYINMELEGPDIDPWVYQQAVTAAAAICRAMGWTAARNVGHLEWTNRKVDPIFTTGRTMNQVRADVAAQMEEPVDATHLAQHKNATELTIDARSWADPIWAAYLGAGGSTVPDSRIWRTSREDVAYLWWKFIRPVTEQNSELAARVAELEKAAARALEARIAAIEATVAAIHDATD
jgi:hypothetical protein